MLGTRLYTVLCRSAGRLVNQLAPFFTFSAFLSFLCTWLLPRCSNRVCKIIRTCSIERKPYLEVTQHYEIRARVPQLVILESEIDCRSFLHPLSLRELNDLNKDFDFDRILFCRENRIQNHSSCIYNYFLVTFLALNTLS